MFSQPEKWARCSIMRTMLMLLGTGSSFSAKSSVV